ncbi:MAG: phosphoribosylformylglycinamidine synthase I [Clostridia bacterium]|nr:phosphoribosylformylglycinamidine synthase I [Deltaproteobacteria bacterium]
MSSTRPEAAVLVFPGTNGDRDMAESFERAGFKAVYVDSRESVSKDAKVIGVPGGFAYGDYWRAGMLARYAPAVRALPDFVANGGLVIGICNGFQILVEAGLLPGALTYNDPPGFRHKWVTVEVKRSIASPWLARVKPGDRLRWPMAHGEGNYYHPDGASALADHVPFVYERDVNGSIGRTAALLDSTGRVLGVMPHPDRAIDPHIGSTDGVRVFVGARESLDHA